MDTFGILKFRLDGVSTISELCCAICLPIDAFCCLSVSQDAAPTGMCEVRPLEDSPAAICPPSSIERGHGDQQMLSMLDEAKQSEIGPFVGNVYLV